MEATRHIRHTHESKRGETWCGLPAPAELVAYQGLDHAAYSVIYEGSKGSPEYLPPCPECAEKAKAAIGG